MQDDGTMAAVWLAHDPDSDVLHLYDACLFRREVLAVIAEGLNARGRWIPVAWVHQEVADELVNRGCNMLPDPSKETEAMAEVMSREIWERMRSGRFKVDKRLSEWLEEYRTFSRKDAKVPEQSHPLMAATRHAMGELAYARAEQAYRSATKNYPKISIA